MLVPILCLAIEGFIYLQPADKEAAISLMLVGSSVVINRCHSVARQKLWQCGYDRAKFGASLVAIIQRRSDKLVIVGHLQEAACVICNTTYVRKPLLCTEWKSSHSRDCTAGGNI